MSKIIYSRRWNFDWDQPFEIVSTLKEIKKETLYFKATYSTHLKRVEHRMKKGVINPLLESFDYTYENNHLIKRECKDRWGFSKWLIQFHYEENQLVKSETFLSNHKEKVLENYSLYLYESRGERELKKIFNPKDELMSYEVYFYNENHLLHRKEMFDQEHQKLFVEMYHYIDKSLSQIDYFNAEGQFERSLQVGGFYGT